MCRKSAHDVHVCHCTVDQDLMTVIFVTARIVSNVHIDMATPDDDMKRTTTHAQWYNKGIWLYICMSLGNTYVTKLWLIFGTTGVISRVWIRWHRNMVWWHGEWKRHFIIYMNGIAENLYVTKLWLVTFGTARVINSIWICWHRNTGCWLRDICSEVQERQYICMELQNTVMYVTKLCLWYLKLQGLSLEYDYVDIKTHLHDIQNVKTFAQSYRKGV